ncbi:MAG: DMT family transporter [Actinomycetota bacterium]|jgi:drug/metabolite transporter (DMT)-like permease|nr:DMT family transporter [Actinomycetota bacterium]
MPSVVFALLAALCIGLGAVFKQLAAEQAPTHRALHPGLILYLVRKPIWLIGLVIAIVGYAAQATALGLGKLLVVEPVLVTNLVFALLIAAVWRRQRPSSLDWLAAVLASSGVAAFLISSSAHGGTNGASFVRFAPALGAVVIVAMAGLFLPSRVSARLRAVALAAGAGITFGVSDALTKAVLHEFAVHGIGALASFEPYALVVVGGIGLLFEQSAYHTARLAASLPAMSALEPIIGSLLGVVIFAERLQLSGMAPVVEVLGAVAMIVGVVLLARSPTVVMSAPTETPSAESANHVGVESVVGGHVEAPVVESTEPRNPT